MTSTLAADLTARMAPTPEQVAAAVVTAVDAGTDMAIVPIAFPGKEYGVWTIDERVEHPAGVWPVNNDHDPETGYRAGTNAASLAAAKHLGEEPGTVGYVAVYPDAVWAVFEEILTPADILKFAETENR